MHYGAWIWKYLNFIQQCHCIPRCHLCRGECWGLHCRSSKETSLGLRRMRCHCWRDVLICSKIRNGTAVLCKLLKSRRLKNHIRNGNTAKSCIKFQMLHHRPILKSLMSLLKTALILLTAKQRYMMAVLIKDKSFRNPQTEWWSIISGSWLLWSGFIIWSLKGIHLSTLKVETNEKVF